MIEEDCLFIEYAAPCHTTKMTEDLLDDEGIERIPQPRHRLWDTASGQDTSQKEEECIYKNSHIVDIA